MNPTPEFWHALAGFIADAWGAIACIVVLIGLFYIVCAIPSRGKGE